MDTSPTIGTQKQDFSESDFRQYYKEVSYLLKIAKTKPRFFISIDEQKKTFNSIYSIDLTYPHYKWQMMEDAFHRHPIEKHRARRFQVKKYPRRHGKSYFEVHDQVASLLKVPYKLPIGAYYCVDRDQSVRNTWGMFKEIVEQLPGAKSNKSKGEIVIPRPLLGVPENYIMIYFFGIRGGSGTKRGSYYDHCVMDEVGIYPPKIRPGGCFRFLHG